VTGKVLHWNSNEGLKHNCQHEVKFVMID